jgi:hypothetical protein
MISEALAFIAGLATKAEHPVKLESSPRTLRYAIGGTISEHDKAPEPRRHVVDTLEQIISLANRFRDEAAAEGDDTDLSPVVWYDAEQVVLVIDDAGHRLETARLTLATSDVFYRLNSLDEDRQTFNHKQFMRLLRVDLAGTLAPSVLLEKLKNLRIENGQVASSRIGRADESMGRTINAKVASEAGEIPEVVTLGVPVYSTPGETERLGISCAVEIDPGMGTFELIPLPDEIERVRQIAVESIGERLKAGLHDGIPCYQGKP